MQTKNSKAFSDFKEFYPFYLSEHSHPLNRVAHFIGSFLALLLITIAMFGNYFFLLFALLAGYGCAWIGHFVIEKNRPATFKYPIYSFLGDWVLFYELLTRKRPFDESA